MAKADLNEALTPAPELRAFDDYRTTRKNILDRVHSAVLSRFPLKNTRYAIELQDLQYTKDDDFSLKRQQDAIMQGQSLYIPLRARLRMRDLATGSVVDETPAPVTLARVPYLTDRGTFIKSGNEYTVANQSRLLAGPYVRRRKSGEYEAHFNTNPGQGRGFRMVFVPDTGKFVMEIGQSQSPAYPALRALGVDDATLEKVWGPDILAVNKEHSAYDAHRLYERLTNDATKGLDDQTVYEGIKNALQSTKLDPEVTRRTLGRSSLTMKSGAVPMRGTLRVGAEGWLTVPSDFIDSVYYALRDSDEATGIHPQPDKTKGRLVVITEDEMKDLKSRFKRDFDATVGSGRRFTYNLREVVHPSNSDDCWRVEVMCEDLEQFRRSLGLSSRPDRGFYVCVGERAKVAAADDLSAALDLPKKRRTKAAPPSGTSFLKEPLQLQDADYGAVTGNTLLRASQKVLNAQNGYEDTDDRDSLAYQKILGPEDFFSERIEKDAGGVLRTALFKATNRGNLVPLTNSVMTPVLNSVLVGSGLGAPIEEVNPVDIMDQTVRVIRTGEGGIGSAAHGIPVDTRSVQPSHLGFIDPVRTPECLTPDAEIFTSLGWLPIAGVTTDTEVLCMPGGVTAAHEGVPSYRKPSRVIAERYRGPMYGMDNGRTHYLVTPNHQVLSMPYELRGGLGYRLSRADEVHSRSRLFPIGHNPVVQDCLERTFFDLPGQDGLKLDICDWAEFLGWYIAEGSTACRKAKTGWRDSRVIISQCRKSNPGKYEQIRQLLARMPFRCVSVCDRQFSIYHRDLHAYLQQLGYCYEKFIPEYMFSAPVEARKRLLEALLLGDGRTFSRRKNGQSYAQRVMTTTSPQLARDFERLGTTLGYATTVSVYPDNREERYLDVYEIRLLKARRTASRGARHKCYKGEYYVHDYDGMVHCVTVPGSLIYVRMPGRTGVWTGNSGSVGVDLRLAIGTMKGSDGQVYTKLRSPKTGKEQMVAARQVVDSVIAFPGELRKARASGDPVRAMVKGRISYVEPGEVDFELPGPANMFNINSNLVPGVSGIKGGRLLMGSKYFSQALPIKDAETPFVQSLVDGDTKSYEESISRHLGAVSADPEKGAGLVTDVSPDEVTVKHADGKKSKYQLYNNFPFNLKTLISNTPVVKIGDKIQPGQMLAKSNYTDDKGSLAMGKNLRVAYMVYGDPESHGANFEDGVVVSESAAKKMSAEHLYLVGYDNKDDYKADRNKFISLFPGRYTAEQLKGVGPEGVVKPGTLLNYGDPIILGVGERSGDVFGLMKKSRPSYVDRAQTWEHQAPGVVTNVTKTRTGFQVAVKAYRPMEVGDKLVGRYGDKGIISLIVPDSGMPQGEDGKPYEVIYNPLALVTRVNPSQAMEAALGKVAERTGKSIKVPGFMDESLIDFAQRTLREHGLKDTEKVFDPQLNRHVDNVFTGNRYFLNLHHQAEKKLTGRDVGAYSTDEAPLKGGDEGAKRIGIADINAILAHGAVDVLRDARLIRGQKNDDYWRAVKLGQPLPSVSVPFVWEKLVGQLQASGVNVRRQGGQVHIYGMTGDDVKTLSGGPVTEGKDIDFRTGEAIKGGLFDEAIFGANKASFGHIPLASKVVNPVMEDAVRSIVGLTQKDLEAVMSGEEAKGIKGVSGLEKRLSSMDIDKEIKDARAELSTAKGQRRSSAVSRLSYLEAMKKHKVRPENFLWDSVPVLPPRFRPITDTGRMQMISDSNYLYKELFALNKNLQELESEVGPEAVSKEKLAVYKAVKALVGLADPSSAKLQQKNVNGLIRHVLGNNPKFSMFQRKVLSSTVEGVGNAVITPDPSLDMDHVGIPEKMAFQVFRPYVIQAMVRAGATPMEATKAVEERTQSAKQELMRQMDQRPVMITRAPVLHKYNFLAARPVLSAGNTMRLSPSVVVGFNADFDGDQMRLHVPSSPAAVRQAYEKMLPSRNLLSASTFQAHPFIKNEFLYGLFLASKGKPDRKVVKTFRSREDVVKAFNRGELTVDDTVRIVQ